MFTLLAPTDEAFTNALPELGSSPASQKRQVLILLQDEDSALVEEAGLCLLGLMALQRPVDEDTKESNPTK